MIESISRNIYRVLRNFTFLVALQFNLEIFAVPVYYVVGLFQWGWYVPTLWLYKSMLVEPGFYLTRHVMVAFLILVFWEFFRAFWVLTRGAFRTVVRLSK